MASFESARQALLRALAQSVSDCRVLDAIAKVPRERFLSEDLHSRAYEDAALPIGQSQTISQPTIVAMMTEALAPQGQETVLEVGAGCGYQAAVLSYLAKKVVSVERHPLLAAQAARTLRAVGIDNVEVHVATDVLGWPQQAPYDAIIVTAAAPLVPQTLLDQLKEGGRMVVPVGGRDFQELLVVTKQADRITRRSLGGCRFVPLIGNEAWSEADTLHFGDR